MGQDGNKKPPESTLLEKPDAEQRPLLLRSISLASKSSTALSGNRGTEITALRSQNSETKDKNQGQLMQQQTLDAPPLSTEQHTTGPLMFKPSINLARLMFNRSKHGAANREFGYGKVLSFVLQYHDLNGLKVAMKQSMRVAGVRAFAMEVRNYTYQHVHTYMRNKCTYIRTWCIYVYYHYAVAVVCMYVLYIHVCHTP